MSSLETESRKLTELIQELVNQFHFLKTESVPPESEFNLRELRVILLLGCNGSSKMSEIAEKLGMPLSTATGLLDRLVEKGLVERERSIEDRRIVQVDLTEKGHEIHQWDFEEHTQFARQILRRLGKSDRKIFLDLMKKIMANKEELTNNADI